MDIIKEKVKGLLRWLQPGLGIKRWILAILLGTTIIALGLALFVIDLYRRAPETWWLPLISFASLRDLPRLMRVIIFEALGLGIIVWGIIGLNRSLLGPFLRPGHTIVDRLEKHQSRKHGPKIVAIGGGHGLATLLRGLKTVSHNIYAVVTVADDGGSSGRLRESLGILPPGDVRNCLAALSDDEDLLAQLFQYRFANDDESLKGHSFGNLFISSMAEVTGSFEQAIAESGRVLAVSGRVLPATLENVQLIADVRKSDSKEISRVVGESKITETGGIIKRVMLEPNNPAAYPEVIQSVLSADLIVIGPGSLYTSILPNLLVKDITSAIKASQALKIFVCNVATQAGETEGFSCGDHLRVVEDHVGSNIFDIIVANDIKPSEYHQNVEGVETEDELSMKYNVYKTDLIDVEHPWRHDSDKITQVLMDLLRERTGPLTM
ncbi:MAG: uridine diphosphate-N-acetylglucosamine-binding protein YvcK [Anaerolineales bacterium]|nr:uridine diphosphate-N-acetylglucosamine-binding protein YvcK [Anaerolineales bacterium]